MLRIVGTGAASLGLLVPLGTSGTVWLLLPIRRQVPGARTSRKCCASIVSGFHNAGARENRVPDRHRQFASQRKKRTRHVNRPQKEGRWWFPERIYLPTFQRGFPEKILKYILSSDFYVTQIEFILINHSIENI